jgi:hypothetical protein
MKRALVLSAVLLLTGSVLFAQNSFYAVTFADQYQRGNSTITKTEASETIDGKTYTTYTFDGKVTNKYQYGFIGCAFVPGDDATVAALQTAKAITFMAQDLGSAYNRYRFALTTTDIADSAYYGKEIPFSKKDPVKVTINIPKDLNQPSDWGIAKPFNQSLAKQIQFQSTNNGSPGACKFKIYDIQIVK